MARRLVVFSDPGGAKPCLTLAEQWAERDEVLACSDRTYAFFENFAVKVRPARGADAAALFDEFRPDSLFTATSYTSRIETDFIREAAVRQVNSTAFVDHYTCFRERFVDGEHLVLPNTINVLDDTAREMALAAGLPPHSLRITGNPYHNWLRDWKPRISKSELWATLGLLDIAATTILFMPDPISNTGGVAKYGTDEAVVLATVVEALKGLEHRSHLIIKPHPNQNVAHLASRLPSTTGGLAVSWVDSEHDRYLNELMSYAELVIGMFSNALRESEILGTPVLRVTETARTDSSPVWPIGTTITVVDVGTLSRYLLALLGGKQWQPNTLRTY